mgnify:CR=1 FL=1
MYEAELEKSRTLAGNFKSETFKLAQEISNLNNQLAEKESTVEKYLNFMAKLQKMNNKLLKRVKAAEKHTQVVSSKDRVIKKLEEMERQLQATKENQMLDNKLKTSATRWFTSKKIWCILKESIIPYDEKYDLSDRFLTFTLRIGLL